VSEKEKKEKIEVKEPQGRAIEPWRPSDVSQAFDEMWDDFRRDFFRPWEPWRPWRAWGRPWRRRRLSDIIPREACTDLVDTGNAYQVCAEVPGIPKEQLDVTITKDSIEISGKAEVKRKEEDKGYIVRERGYTEIHRQIAFPEEVRPEQAEATLKQGLLEITVPKKTPTPKAKKHKVEIK
jgi:HSP20 family protein